MVQTVRDRHYDRNVSGAPSTHWGRVTHICVSNLTIIGSDNGLSPGRLICFVRCMLLVPISLHNRNGNVFITDLSSLAVVKIAIRCSANDKLLQNDDILVSLTVLPVAIMLPRLPIFCWCGNLSLLKRQKMISWWWYNDDGDDDQSIILQFALCLLVPWHRQGVCINTMCIT